MSQDPIAQYIAKKSGLPEKAIKDGSDDPIASYMYKKTGDANVFAPAAPSTNIGFSGLDLNAATISLTNTYTDPLESYTSYGVPRNAFADWNDIRAQNQSTAEKWAHGLTKAGITALGAVAENTIGVAGGLLNLAFGENHSYYDNPVGRSIDSINEWAQEAMPNYYTKKEEQMGVLEGLGTANFWADKFANGAGYTLGSIATAWLGVGEGAMLAKMANVGRMSKIAKAADKAMDITQDAAKFGSKQFQLYNAAKVVNAPYSQKFTQGIEQGLAKMAKQAGIKTAAKNLSVSLHMSLAEASVEAREAKNKFIEEQTAKWEEENPGQEMSAEVEDAIMASASAVGNVTFGVNLPLLATTNAVSFGKMFMGIKPTAESKIFDIKKVGDKWVEAIPEKGMAKAFAKSARIFGAPLRNSISEGAQEAGQFITAESAGDYYSDKFADGIGDMSEAFVNGLSRSIGTKEGLESILIGALVGGGSGTISRLVGADKKFAKEKTANTQKALQILNSEGFGKVLENMEQSQRNMALVKDMTEANEKGDFKNAEIARRKLISSVANQYRKAGALDFAKEQLDDLKQLDETEFKKRWGYDANRTLKEQTGMEQGELIDDVKSKMDRSVKRQEQVQDILRAQQPSTGMFARILNSFESEELRKSKTLESSIRNMYANVLLNRLEDVDTHDDLIKQAYKDLHEMAPTLSALPEEEFEYLVKTGKIKIDDKGEISISPETETTLNPKLKDKLNEIFKAKAALNPEDAIQFVNKAQELGGLIQARQSAVQSYQELRNKPEDIALLVEAEVERRKLTDEYKNKQQAKAAIENSESTDELNKAFPKNADPDDIAAAMAKREELLAKEDAIIANYKKMSKEEFDAIDPETLSPLEEAAYNRYKKKVDEMEAEKNFQKDIGVSFPDENAANQAAASYEEVLSDIEARTFGEVMVSPGGDIVSVNGRNYANLEDNPLDAILRDEQGAIVGVRMTDLSTGNEVTWKSIDPADSSNPEVAERENAIAEGLAYMTLLKAASIRPNQTVPLSEAKEELEPRIQAAKEDAEVRNKFEENTESTDSERELAKNNLSKTAGLTDDQLRAQIETLKADLEEINEIITAEEQIAREAGFTKKEFDADPQTKELRAIKKRITQLLNSKIKALRDRKQTSREESLNTTNTEAIVEPVLSPSEEDLIKAGLDEEIKKLEDDMVPLTEAAKGYQDIINGKYGEGQDVTAATVALKETNKKIAVIKAKITKRRNKINSINNERESEKLRQDRDSAEGVGIAPEGQEPEGKDITPGEGTPSEGLDGILDQDEVKKLRQQREQAERLRKQQEENKKAQQPTPQPINISPAPVTISKPGELDVRLAKGEKQVLNGKILVADTGMSLPSDTVEQTSNNEAIKVNHSLSSNPAIAPTGTQVRFEVREDTDWWISQSPNIPADEHWKTVPIYMVVKDAEGVEQRVALLQSATEDSGQMRRDIYNLHKQGLTPVATSAGKIFNTSNYSNARLADGTAFFYPAASLMQAGQTPAIAIVGVKDTVKTFKVTTQGDATFPNLEDTVEASDASNLTLGQVAIVTMDPNGKPILVTASTRSMTESGRTAALGHITGEVPSLGNFAQIVGTNLLLNDSVDPSQNENVYTEINNEMQQEYSENAKNFMLVETLADGTELITFFSPSANSLVRMNAQNMKLALLGSKPMFSFVEVGTNEKGFNALVTAKKDGSVRSAVEMKLSDEFRAVIMNKKFQVDKTLLNNKEAYTSPITGEVYPSYFQYLNSEKEVAEDRTEGKGTKAILAVDTEVNSQKSPFFDVGIKTANLGTLEKDVVAEQDLAAKQIAAPSDNNPATSVYDKDFEGWEKTDKERIEKEIQEAKDRIADIENNLLPKINNRLDNNLQPELSKLYEKLRSTKDPVLQKEINDEIDRLSKQVLTRGDILDLTRRKEAFEGQIESAKKFIEKKTKELSVLGKGAAPSTATDKKADIERRNKLAGEVIPIVWERLAKQGITNADSLIGTRNTIENVDFDKFWSNVTKEDLEKLKKSYITQKQEQLELYDKFKGEFDPSTGTITSNDTSFFDNKIKDVDAELAALETDKKDEIERRTNETVENYVNRLFDNNYFIEVDGKQIFSLTQGRWGIVVNVNGIKIPFYQSTSGTDTKIAGQWYPFFGDQGNWVIKGNSDDSNIGYGFKVIQDVQSFLNNNIKEKDAIALSGIVSSEVLQNQSSLRRLDESKIKGNAKISLNKEATAKRLADLMGYSLEEGRKTKSDAELFKLASKKIFTELAALEGSQTDTQNTALSNIESFETSKGSVYTVLPDGKVERFKTAANEKHEPAELIVFVKFDNEDQEQDFLSAQHRQGGMKLYVIDSDGNIYNKNSEVVGKNVKLAIIKDNKVLAAIDASTEPKIGYNTFDQRRFEKNGEKYRSTHLGNTVNKINYKTSPALKGKPSTQVTPTVTQPVANNDIVTVYHHTPVAPKDFDFGNFQRGKNAVSQFGDGLNAASTTTPFFVSRYGNPIKGEVRDSEFIVIDANMSQKEMYEMLVAKGFKFNTPQMGKSTPEGASYVGGNAASEYDDTSPLKDSPGAAIDLFKDFQQSNLQVKGVKVINHKIGNQEVDPFYVIYDAKSFYGPGSLSKSNVPAKTQPAAPSEEKVVEITGAEDTGSIFELFGQEPKAATNAEDINPETGLPSFFDKYRVDDTFAPPGDIEDFATMAARNQAQAEETNKQCKVK